MSGTVLPRRYLCLWLPFLAADRWRRDNAAAEQAPLVFVEKVRGTARLSAVDRSARSWGLAPDMTLTDARARIPQLRAIAADPPKDAAFLEHIADLALSFTPSVALDEPEGLALDITGCSHLFAGEEGLVARLRAALHAAGVSDARVAVAPTPDMARALARFARTSPCFADDDTQVRMLPVAALECEPADDLALRRAGLTTIADVASRPSVLFTARFSSAFTVRLARVLGEEDRRISPLRKPAPCRAERRCAEPIASHDAIAHAISGLTLDVAHELRARGEGGRSFEATFLRTDGAVRRIRVETSQPTRDPHLMLRLYNDRLEAIADPLDPGFGFDLIRFEVLRAEPYIEGQATLDAYEDRDDKIAQLVDRLSAMFGRERIARLQPVDTHLPERAQTIEPAVDAAAPRHRRDGLDFSGARSRPPLLYERPHPIDVEADARHMPMRMRWRRMTYPIASAAGPERISDEWWRAPSGYGTRDYYRVESADNRRFWIFRASATSEEQRPKWFLHGLFP